jgi:hypothetical protein
MTLDDIADDGIDRINEERFEYDLPQISREEYWQSIGEYMEETYGYDIDK